MDKNKSVLQALLVSSFNSILCFAMMLVGVYYLTTFFAMQMPVSLAPPTPPVPIMTTSHLCDCKGNCDCCGCCGVKNK